ncbi:glycoside hydrolase family 15 protein [Antrihabitans sp. YC2-6]|uniref:glycoside hydrolase family 15 protein n=1 Tax=Antrihabitans sp. YC2-6 TaxID=2799498 RepID=UPI0018F5357E|nr:glycoside hydrolase family 15 protein [Antrihabitans sp. YC2-6]MBJ8347540.1 glycoside hydrolase family 15 protein [Antrihabitans sp. YC2-6]
MVDQVPKRVLHPHVLRDYALLADGERGALVGPTGNISWMCVPRWHSEAVFSTLIGGTGMYVVKPTASRFVWGGWYEDRSLIWHNRWVTEDSSIIECREALAFPGDPDRAVLLRRVLPLHGAGRVDVELDVRAGFGRFSMTRLKKKDGIWTMRSGDLRLRLSGADNADIDSDGVLHAVIDVRENDHHDLVLELSDKTLPREPVSAVAAWEATEHSWKKEVPLINGTLADRDSQHSYAVMRGLTSSNGGMVAAPTMSLPERARRDRNYDYRYSWIRDQCYAGLAAGTAEATPLLDEAIRFVSERVLTDGPDLRPAYTTDGSAVPSERRLDLPGYPGGRPKTGNWVNNQFQLDTFGDALLLFAAGARLDRLDTVHWHAVEATVSAIEKRWQEKDAGIWEIQNDRWAHSRLNCAAGLRAVGAVAPAPQAAVWNSMADRIVAETSADCLHPTGRWQRAPGDPRVDAALLIPLVRGAVAADDPRTRATLDAVRAELCADGYVYRFRQDPRPLSDAEGAFLLCGYVMAWATHQQGNDVEALRLFERNRAACGPPGLFTEEYDVDQRQMRGNLPQAFVHAVMLESAHRLAELDPMDKETAS